jgi:hypothetical protein
MAEPERKDDETPGRYPKLEALQLPGPWTERDQVWSEVLLEEYDGPILPPEDVS